MSGAGKTKIHPNKEAFIEGVDHILAKWTALSLAVANSWGGPESEEKRDNMVDEIVEYFDGTASKKQAPEPSDLEELLLDIMDEDFTISLEDGSEKEVSKKLITIYSECRIGNFATVDRLAEERDAREARGGANSSVQMSQAGGNAAATGSEDEFSGSEDDEDDESDVEMS
ncbi:rRNA accumulation- protein [Coemansia erecta]|nr:rRNA accumulation- protein [Coemansia erecta]KAJ2883429.1 rRNA accumulation- protein [Coemansia asiatica]